MAHVMPQVALHRVIQEGIGIVRDNIDVLDDIFQYYTTPLMVTSYGQVYIDQIKQWFLATDIPVTQAWSADPQQLPQIAIKLASEAEDESKASMGDYFGPGEDSQIGVSVFTVQLDVSIKSSKTSDEVLWLYYIVNYILFKRKQQAIDLGLELGTFSASDYLRDVSTLPENVWVRNIRYRCVVQNLWDSNPYIDISDINTNLHVSSTSDIGDSEDIQI